LRRSEASAIVASMSWQQADEPRSEPGKCPGLETVIAPRSRDLGGFDVRRVLPSARRRSVGPFVFWDQMGPATFAAGRGIDVRPHPHIGLATITYLFAGEIMHRDSLGSAQVIRPGEVNWMTAGRGIVHSERTPPERRRTAAPLFGIQAWVALPHADEECEPSFSHHAGDALPVVDGDGTTVRVLVGALYGARSAVPTRSPMFYADATLETGASLVLPADHDERGVHVAEGELVVGDDGFAAGQMLVFRPGDEIPLRARVRSRVLLLGGAGLDGPRHVWWNFVSSSRERMERAKADWKDGRFAPVPGETEFIPLPET
jgi:redox-sensitive bicupin YhaK (pirin superfamily)